MKRRILFVSALVAVSAVTAQTVVNVLPPQETATQKVTVEVENNVAVIHPRTVTLVVQNHASYGAEIPVLVLTDALSAKLSGRGLQVINPYNSYGENLNRTSRGEALPETSAMAVAKQLKADGVVTASVLEFMDSTFGTPPMMHQYSIRISLNLADVQTGAVICGEVVKRKSQKYTNAQVAQNKMEYLGDLMYAAAEECAERLKNNPKVKAWRPTPPPPQPSPKYPYEPLVLGDVENAINVLRGKLLEDGKFNDRYSELFAQRGGSPVLTVGGINDLTKGKAPCAKLGEYVDLAKGWLQTTLGKTHRFSIKDFAAVEELRPYIKNTDKDPLSDRSLLEALQRHLQPDLFVAGHIKYIAESGIGTYYIHLGAYDFLKGVVIWEDDVEVIKTLPKGDAK